MTSKKRKLVRFGGDTRNEPEDFEEQVDRMLSTLALKLQEQRSLGFSGDTSQNLNKPKITFAGILDLKPDIQERIKNSISLGHDIFWSSENLHRQLLCLADLVSRSPQTCRALVDAFFFRASAMLPPAKRMILNTESTTPATIGSPSTRSGSIGYAAMVTSERAAGPLLNNPTPYAIQVLRPLTFFIVEASTLFHISDQVPQAVSEIYTRGKFLQTKFLRGALTNGREWIFLHLKLADDHDGASYSQSSVTEWSAIQNVDGTREIVGSWPDLIAAILADWTQTSFSDIDNDAWFEYL